MKKFINDNKLSFKEGNRNITVVTLIGYSQHLGLTKEKLEETLAKEITKDSFIQDEINRLWDYCKTNNYKNYWAEPEAFH